MFELPADIKVTDSSAAEPDDIAIEGRSLRQVACLTIRW